MPLKKEGAILLLCISGLAVIITLLILPEALPEIGEEPLHVLTRLFALYGFLFVGVATLTTPFLREVTQAFGNSFLKVHHAFSILGFIFITLHPISNAFQEASLSVFLPSFDSWTSFWTLAGRPAFIIFYVALFAAFLQRNAPRYWRPFHALMYLVLFFGIVHANFAGEDFQNLGITIIFDTLFILTMAGFTFKRCRNYQMKRNLP